jgi:peroxiredoxin
MHLYDNYSPKGLQIVGIVIYYNDPKEANKMVQNKKMPYRILLDRDKKATYAFGGVHFTPSSFLIAPDGKIIYRQTGSTNFAVIRELLQQFVVTGK